MTEQDERLLRKQRLEEIQKAHQQQVVENHVNDDKNAYRQLLQKPVNACPLYGITIQYGGDFSPRQRYRAMSCTVFAYCIYRRGLNKAFVPTQENADACNIYQHAKKILNDETLDKLV
jgi:hypothetical protein